MVDHAERRERISNEATQKAFAIGLEPVKDDALLDELAGLGVSYDDVVQVLEDEGVAKFAASWNELLDTIRTSMEH